MDLCISGIYWVSNEEKHPIMFRLDTLASCQVTNVIVVLFEKTGSHETK